MGRPPSQTGWLKMKVTNETIYRLTASMNCGCSSKAEYAKANCEEIIQAPTFIPCEEHREDTSSKIIGLVLCERLEEVQEEKKKAGLKPAPITPRVQAGPVQNNNNHPRPNPFKIKSVNYSRPNTNALIKEKLAPSKEQMAINQLLDAEL